MKLKARDLWNGRMALDILAGKQMPSRVAYEFSRQYKRIKAELVTISEQSRPIIERHGGIVEEQTGRIIWPADKEREAEAAFLKELGETILETEVEVQLEPLALWKLDGVDVPPAVYIDLDWLFVDEPRPPDKARPG